jgi:hypothetical protein
MIPMSRGSDLIESAHYDDTVAEIRNVQAALSQEHRNAAEGRLPGLFDYLEAVLDYTLVVTATATPDAVPDEFITEIAQDLGNLREQITNFSNNLSQLVYVDNVRSQCTGLLRHLATWPGGGPDPARESITQAASTFRRSAGQQLSGLSQEIDSSKGQIEALQQRLNEFAARIAEGTQQVTTLTGEVERVEAQATQTLNQFQAQFSEAQERRLEAHQTALNELRESMTAFREEVKEASDNRLGEMSGLAAAVLDKIKSDGAAAQKRLDEQVDAAKAMVTIITAAGTANAYGEEASEQKSAADRWRWITVAFFLVAIGVAVWAILEGKPGNAEFTAARAVGSLAILGIAGYTANQSTRHRRREEAAKRRQIQLVAFQPFIEDLPKEKQNEARETLIATLFGPDGHVVGGDDEPSITKDQISLFGQAWELFQKMRKS